MSLYIPGDVILARMRIGGGGERKMRPFLLITQCPDGTLAGYPISRSSSWDQPFLPLGLHDFQEGGLDILDESYVLTAKVTRIGINDVAGKKGRVRREFMDRVCAGRRT